MQMRNNCVGDQRNDCTVRALATATGRDYVAVLQALRQAGRKDHRGFDVYHWIDSNDGEVLGCRFTRVASLSSVGRFIIGNCGHVCAVVNGIRYDYPGACGMRYKWCYLVERNVAAWEPPKATQALLDD